MSSEYFHPRTRAPRCYRLRDLAWEELGGQGRCVKNRMVTENLGAARVRNQILDEIRERLCEWPKTL